MISRELTVFLALLRAGTLGERPEPAAVQDLPEDWDVKQTAQLAQLHDVVLTVYAALEGAEEPALQRLKKELSRSYAPGLARAVNQDCEGAALLEAFEQAGIDCIPLKGWVMRQFYADPLSRCMADFDVLVRDYRYEKIRALMENLGYRGRGHSPWKHDSFVKEPFMHVEVHKRLTDNSDGIQAWERRIWDRCVPSSGREHVFNMREEDFYVFHLVHMYKDFKNGALGFRRLSDLWLLNRKLDPDAIRAAEEKLEELNMGLFARRMKKLATVCFEGEAPDPDSLVLLDFAAEGAAYTDDQRYKLGRMAASRGGSARTAKLRSVLKAVFLPRDRMKAQYPAVEKHPILLPWFWGKRILHAARHPAGKLKRLNYSQLSEQQYQQMRHVFQAGGILTEKNGRVETL